MISRIINRLGYSYRYGKWLKNYNPEPKEFYAGKKILDNTAANKLISEKIISGQPFLVARIGSTELSVLYNYLLHRNKKKVVWDKSVLNNIQQYSGFFPVTEQLLNQFSEKYLESISCCDILGVWYNEGEEYVCRNYCPEAIYVPLASIEPYYHDQPWSGNLNGKKVLVIHPFADSIMYQYYHHRKRLFGNKSVLPEFELKTIKAVQSIAFNETGFSDWFEALYYMYREIEKTAFEIPIIGAGAYGLPLGAFVKQLGRQAIHMGGATQILFGIRGNRWEKHPVISEFFNEYWKKPNPDETPRGANTIENACYW